MKKHHFLLAFHSLVFVAASLLYYNYLHLDGILFSPIVTYPTTQDQTENDTYHSGGDVSGIGTFCVHRDVEIEVNYFLVDTYIRSYPTRYLHFPKGCYTDKSYEMIQIPPEAHSGNYHIEAQYTAHLNFTNTVQWTRVTNDFQVVK